MTLNKDSLAELGGAITDLSFDLDNIDDNKMGWTYSTRLYYLRNSLKKILDLTSKLLPEVEREQELQEVAEALTDSQKEALRIVHRAEGAGLKVLVSNCNAADRIHTASGKALSERGLLSAWGSGECKVTPLGKQVAEVLA